MERDDRPPKRLQKPIVTGGLRFLLQLDIGRYLAAVIAWLSVCTMARHLMPGITPRFIWFITYANEIPLLGSPNP
jgi:hypothetical protein